MMETITFFNLGFSFLNALGCSQILCDQDWHYSAPARPSGRCGCPTDISCKPTGNPRLVLFCYHGPSSSRGRFGPFAPGAENLSGKLNQHPVFLLGQRNSWDWRGWIRGSLFLVSRWLLYVMNVPLTEFKCFGEVCMLNPLFKKTCCARNVNAFLHLLFKLSE
jgi:hypothetical protein